MAGLAAREALNDQYLIASLQHAAEIVARLMHLAVDEDSDVLANGALIVQDVVAQAFAGSAGGCQHLRQRGRWQLLQSHAFVTLDRWGKLDSDHEATLAPNAGFGKWLGY